MDFFGIPRGTIRSQALSRIAAVSLAENPEPQHPQTNGHTNGSLKGVLDGPTKSQHSGLSGDIQKLASIVTRDDISAVAITHKELEIIFALISSAEFVRTEQQALGLLEVLAAYFIESSTQKFKSHASLQLGPSPWDHLTRHLTKAIITLCIKFSSLIPQTKTLFHQYLSQFRSKEELRLTRYFSLLGFLKSLIDIESPFDGALVEEIVPLFNAEFLDTLESVTMRALEEEHELTYLLEYKTTGEEFNSLLFAKLVQQFFNRVILSLITRDFIDAVPNTDKLSLLDYILLVHSKDYEEDPEDPSLVGKLKTVLLRNITLVQTLCRRASTQIDELDNGATYINLSSAERADLAMNTKALALEVLAAGILTDAVSTDVLAHSVNKALSHPTEAVDPHICPVIICLGSLLTFRGHKAVSGDLIHSFPLLITRLPVDTSTDFVKKIARCLALGLKALNDDPTISTIYALVNMLVSDNLSAPANALRELRLRSTTNTFNSKARPSRSNTFTKTNMSVTSVTVDEHTTDNSHTCKNSITAAMEIAKTYDSSEITKLTVSVLTQKFHTVSKAVDYRILAGLAEIATSLDESNFVTLLKLYDSAVAHADGDQMTIRIVTEARTSVARDLEGKFENPLFYLYLNILLKSVVNLGAVQNQDHRSQGEISEIAVQISLFLTPLAALLPTKRKLVDLSDELVNSFKNFWFNLVVHGYSETSEFTKRYTNQLQIIALNSPPLASDSPIARAETSFELNTVLRRGSSNHNVKDQKHIISGVSNTNVLELKTLSYPKLMFLSATSLLENMRVRVGDCSSILHYFGDPAIAKANIEKFVGSIAISVTQTYTRLAMTGHSPYFTADCLAEQFTNILVLCADRNYDLQDAAFQCASIFIGKLPSTLCTQGALFTLLDLIEAMKQAFCDASRRRYQPRRAFVLPSNERKIIVSDSIKWKQSTQAKLDKNARNWLELALTRCQHDLKALLNVYMSRFCAHVSPYEYSFARQLSYCVQPSDIQNLAPMQIWDAHVMIQGNDSLSEFGDSKDNVLTKALRAHNRALMSEADAKYEQNVQETRRDDQSFLEFSEIIAEWRKSLKKHVGLFSTKHDLVEEGFLKMVYVPSDKAMVDYYAGVVKKNLQSDDRVIMLLLHHFQGTLYLSQHMLHVFTDIALDVLESLKTASLHPFARVLRFKLIKFSLDVLSTHMSLHTSLCLRLITAILDGVLSWFVQSRPYPFGDDMVLIERERLILIDIFEQLKALRLPANNFDYFEEKRELALAFMYDEINKITIWSDPLNPSEFRGESFKANTKMLSFAYSLDPALAFSLIQRDPSLEKSMFGLVAKDPTRSLSHHDSVKYLLKDASLSKYLILAQPVSPTESINLFRPPFIKDPYVLQYNMRALEAQDINLTFFYVPQIVQGLTHDGFGYVSRFIVEVSQVSQKFSHQLIWNLLANSENSELGAEPMIQKILDSYDDVSMDYYQKEFGFFEEVTGISGKLRPYLKNTKAEKKVKIDEEMAKIEILDNVYLPSNPDGVVVDINRTSGKPLQSHAKTPFMATFRIRKDEMHNGEIVVVDKWQSAIFKVGDDVRQDVLALQLVAIFKSVWENAGLDLYCFPNRVTATAPGCGVIDVLPNSISRDMLGREAVNDLYTYFRAKFPDGELELEDAVQNFVKSLAAYSIISYLLQFKDRHNGNIMYDDKGHILHIDFGFCFDIVPGGVKFEACPFKLTKEMVRVMGGSNNTESFQMFEELFIKGFLAMRPYAELIIGNVQTMLGSGLPCFKDKTIKNLRGRFFLEKNDKECIKALKGLIRQSYESVFSVGYDKFQKMTNGIPY